METEFTGYFIYFTDLSGEEHHDVRNGYVKSYCGNHMDLLALELEKSHFFKSLDGSYYPFNNVKSFRFLEYATLCSSECSNVFLK